ALVGIGPAGEQVPVIIVELYDKKVQRETLLAELHEIARQNDITRSIKHFLIHPDFPVDIRHNAKIFREKLGIWATEKLSIKIRFAQEQS
ncbi:MAG: peptide synthase, partial [Desulfobulbaceae bacterium]|nr:peptide synthase [Desulfobulbaceae bacterium]